MLQMNATETATRPRSLRPRLPVNLAGARVATGVTVLCVVLIGVYFVLPSVPQSVLYQVLAWGGPVLMVIGIRRLLPPGARLPWYLLAAGQLALATGDGYRNAYVVFRHHEAPYPSGADIIYLAGYPFLVAGMYLLVRRLSSAEGGFPLLDAALVTIAFGFVQWIYLIEPLVHSADESLFGRVTLVAYPVMDVLLLAVLARYLLTPSRRAPAYLLLVLATFSLLAADEFYGINPNTYVSGAWFDGLWLLSYVLFGVTCLVPSVRTISEPQLLDIPRLSARRLALLGGALATAPIVVIIETAHGRTHSLYLAAVAALALGALVLTRFVGLVRGIEILRSAERTAREEVEQTHARLAEQNEQLIAADRMKDEFVGMISHDLRTPLVSVTGFLELLADGDAGALNAEQNRYVGFVQRAADRLLRQIDDLLVAVSLQAGRFMLEREETNVVSVAADSVDGQRPGATSKGVELRLAGGPTPLVDADPLRLAQIVDNLVSNAVKFTPKGGTVEVRVYSEGGNAVLEIADSGIGIPAAEHSALFERFFRSSNAIEQRIPGTGLGLYIVKSLVEAHGGVISVESLPAEGTTIRVLLPPLGSSLDMGPAPVD